LRIGGPRADRPKARIHAYLVSQFALPPLIQHPADRPHDANITGAAAEIAAELKPYSLVVSVRKTQHDVARRDQHPRSAIAALEPVIKRKRVA